MDDQRQAIRAELLASLRQHQREQRTAKVRAGRVQPRTHREIEQFAADLLAGSSTATTTVTGQSRRSRTPRREGNAVILGEKEAAWLLRVVEAARHHGWTVFGNQARNQRPHEPSLVLMHGQRIALVFLRTTSRNDRQPPTAYLDKIPGVEVLVWTPKDWPTISTTLATARSVAPKWTATVEPIDGEAADVELGAMT